MLTPGFGERLKEARELAHKTQDDVAILFDYKKAAVSAWERGTNIPSVAQLAVLCEALKVSSEWLLFAIERPPISIELLRHLSKLGPDEVRRIENGIRGTFDMPLLPTGQVGKTRRAA